jgi:hypothetical protein
VGVGPNVSYAPFGGFQMVRITVHSSGIGTCVYSGKENTNGFVVTFDDGLLTEDFVSESHFLKFVRMRAPRRRPEPKSAVVEVPSPNGEAADA